MPPFDLQPEKPLPVKPDTDFEPASSTHAAPPSWEENTPTARETRRILAEEEYQKDLFRRILSGARDQATSLGELHAGANALGAPDQTDREPDPSSPETPEAAPPWAADLDNSGNPRWITLSVQKEDPENDRIVPESVLPEPVETSPAKPEQQEGGSRHKQAESPRSLLDRLNIPPRFKPEEKRPAGRRPRPMRGFFRMLLLTAILAMFYHILAQRGWVPRLF